MSDADLAWRALRAWRHWAEDPNPEKGWGLGNDAAESVAFWLERTLNQFESLQGHNEDLRGLYASQTLNVQALAARVRELEVALRPFAETDECDIGFIVGDASYDHTCQECEAILRARAALGPTRRDA